MSLFGACHFSVQVTSVQMTSDRQFMHFLDVHVTFNREFMHFLKVHVIRVQVIWDAGHFGK